MGQKIVLTVMIHGPYNWGKNKLLEL